MKLVPTLIAGVFALSLFGCQSNKPPPDRDLKPKGAIRESDREFNVAIVEGYYNKMVDAGVVREQMIYPYHFLVNSATFTELGRRDMDILAKHYVMYPGHLGVRKGDETKELYDARVQVVLDSLKVAGVRMDRVSVSDGMPGGDGITSDRVILIQKKFDAASSKSGTGGDSDDSMSGTGSATDFNSSGAGRAASTTGGYK